MSRFADNNWKKSYLLMSTEEEDRLRIEEGTRFDQSPITPLDLVLMVPIVGLMCVPVYLLAFILIWAGT